MQRSRIMVASTVLGLSLVLGACGGSGEGSPTESPAESSSESSAEASESPSPSEPSASAASPETAAYCQDLKSAEKQFTSLSQGDIAQFEEAITTLRELGAAAPSEVSADWDSLLVPLNQLESALKRAGLQFDDLEGLSRGKIPRGVDPQKLQALATELQGLSSTEVNEAGAAIEQHAAAECDIQLGQ